MSVRELDANNFSDAEGRERAIVKFFATWCGPCHMLAPVFEEVSEKIKGVNFFSVDVDEAAGIAEKFSVMSVPTMILLEKGKEKDRIVGASNAESLINDIKQKFGV